MIRSAVVGFMYFCAASASAVAVAVAVAQRFSRLSGEIYLNVVSKLQLVEGARAARREALHDSIFRTYSESVFAATDSEHWLCLVASSRLAPSHPPDPSL